MFRFGGILMALGGLLLAGGLIESTNAPSAGRGILVGLLVLVGLALLWLGWRVQKRHGRIDAR